MEQIRDYEFYRTKAGLDFNKFNKLHPEKNGEELFQTFMIRWDLYYKQRDNIIRKYEQRMIDERDDDKLPRIEAEKMYAIAQLEQNFIDVLRIIFGISPDDETAVFGDTIATRYRKFTETHLCKDKPGFYIGDDGLYRLDAYYDEDYISLETMKEYYKLGDEVYKNDKTEPDGEIELFIDDNRIKIPGAKYKDVDGKEVPLHLLLIEKLLELEETKDKMADEEELEKTEDKMVGEEELEKTKGKTKDEIVDEYFK